LTLLNVPERRRVEKSRLLHDELDLPADVRIVVYQGSIQENRGIEPAIEAVRTLDGVVLVVIGYGYHRPTLEAYVAHEGLERRVRFFGPVSNEALLAYTASADVGLCNIVNASMSYYTSLPNKLFEYPMAGVPVVGSDSPEIGRLVREVEIGEVCDPVDPRSLRHAIETILADPDRYRPALERVVTRYNWEVEQEKLLELYDRIG
jgi:glycosyltransferase involved in cell wall biosynthesis